MSKLQISQRAQNVIASPIRKFFPLLEAAEKRGTKVFRLNVGDPDLPTPPVFFQVVRQYGKKTLSYAPSPGIAEHTLAWQKYYRDLGVDLPRQNIIPTVGGAEAILLSLLAVTDPGDEILVFEPLYTSYKSFSALAGIRPVPVTLPFEKNFALPSVKEIEKKISKKTKAVVIINPDNPTGKLWSDKELDTIISLARKHNLFVISDETYREIRFQGKPSCLLAKQAGRGYVILADSASKRFSMPGARIGCLASLNDEVMRNVLKIAQARLSAGTLEQLATVPLLKNSKAYTGKIQKEYLRRRDVLVKGLLAIPGVKFKPALGAFYQAVQLPIKDAEDFVKFLISEFSYQGQSVMVTPMKDFYITPNKGQNEVRIAYVLNPKDLKTALLVLKKGLEAYCQNFK